MATETPSNSGFRQKFGRLVVATLLGVLLGLGIISLVLSNFYVQAITQVDCTSWQMRPESVDLTTYQEVSFTTSDGLTLNGWHIPSQNGATIILLEGIGARGGLLPEGAMLAEHDYGLLLFDWRGCGTSDPALHTLGYRETEDLLAAVEFLDSDTETHAIGALGFSLGGAVAIRGAAVDPRIEAVVAMGNYHDLEAEIYGAGDDSPLLSTILEKEIAWLFQQKTRVDFGQDPEPIELIGQISPRPLLLIYGQHEEKLPPESGRLLFQAAGQPKELWLIPNLGHGAYFSHAPDEFEQRVVDFFDDALLRTE